MTRSLTSRIASHSRSASSRGVLQDVKRQALRALGADAGQLLQLLDESGERIGKRQGVRTGRGSSARRAVPDIDCPSCSSTLRCASLTAATIRSCSISTSSFDTTSGSIVIDCSCLAPLTTTVTMPPPAVASTRSSAICCCSCSCICLACFIMSRMFIDISSTSPRRRGSPPGRRRASPAPRTTTSLRPSDRACRSASPAGAAGCGAGAGWRGAAGLQPARRSTVNLASGQTLGGRLEPRACLLELLAQRF